MLIPDNRRIHSQFVVSRPNRTWCDLTSYLRRASINLGDVSNPGVDGVARLLEFTSAGENGTLASLNKLSPLNQINGQWVPLLWPQREVVLRVALDGNQEYGTTSIFDEPVGIGDGTTVAFNLRRQTILPSSEVIHLDGMPAVRGVDYTINYDLGLVTFTKPPTNGTTIEAEYTYWYTLFHGLLGEHIEFDTQGFNVSCRASDFSKRLQDTYITEVREYGTEEGTSAEKVIQQILDDNLGLGFVQLHCPVSPGFMVRPYQVEYQSVWDAIQDVARQIGWWIGYRRDETTNMFRLTLMEPPRDKDLTTADFVFDRDTILTQALTISDLDIRNIVIVVYRNALTGERATYYIKDQASIDEYWPKAMQIEEDNTRLIDTPEEVERFARAALSDLKDLPALSRLTMPLLPQMDLFAGIKVINQRLSSTEDFYGVQSVRHSLDWDSNRFRTEVIASGKVIGAKTKWLEIETRPGAGEPIDYGRLATMKTPPPPSNFAVAQVGARLVFSWVPVTSEPVTYEIRQGVDWENAQIVAQGIMSDKYEMTPVRGTNTYWIKSVSRSGNYSKIGLSDSVAVTAIPQSNVIVERDELVSMDGVRSNLLAIEGELSLQHKYKWSDLNITWAEATDIKWESPVVTLGSYETQPIDLGKVFNAIVSLEVNGTNRPGTSRTLYISYSNDEINYTPFAPIVGGGQYLFRFVKFKAEFKSSGEPNKLRTFNVTIDVPDMVQRGTSLEVPTGGITIAFEPQYAREPAITVTTVGTVGIPRVTSQSADKFTIKVFDNEGQDVGGLVNWTAIGY